MAKLIMNPHSPARRDVALPRTILSIGRDPSNDLVLPDAMVSRRHALIECRGSQFFLRDCNSSNGSLVNGDRVSERTLRDGDLVAIGAARLLFREELELVDSGGKVVQHPSAPRLLCPSCRSDYRKGDAFCRQCGARVQEVPAKVVCVDCGTVVPLPARFCNACGGRLALDATPALPDTGSRAHESVPGVTGIAGEGATVPAQEPVPQPPPPETPADDGRATPQPVPPVESALAPAPGSRPPLPRSRVQSEPALERAVALAGPVHEARPATAPSRPRLVPQVPAGSRDEIDSRRSPRPPADAVAAGSRCVATLVDVLIVGGAQALLLLPLLWLRPSLLAGSSWGDLVTAAGLGLLVLSTAAAYQVYFWGRRGATPGQRLLGVEVQARDGTRPIGLRAAAVRCLGWALSAAALGLGFLPILWGAQGLHDRLAGTRVVGRPRS